MPCFSRSVRTASNNGTWGELERSNQTRIAQPPQKAGECPKERGVRPAHKRDPVREPSMSSKNHAPVGQNHFVRSPRKRDRELKVTSRQVMTLQFQRRLDALGEVLGVYWIATIIEVPRRDRLIEH